MSAGARSRDGLMPVTALELGIELRMAGHTLMHDATHAIVTGKGRRHAHSLISDATTLDILADRLEAGTLSLELAELFADAADTLARRGVRNG